jgi:AcrR family transcriptional regulator
VRGAPLKGLHGIHFDNHPTVHTFVSNMRMASSNTLLPRAAAAADSHGATRDVILDAAERLFSQNGVEGTSVREIIKAAEVNLGAINYHFGTKERLAVEVFARRLKPVNEERIARLDALEAAAGRRKVKLEQIIDAMIRPAVEAKTEGAPGCDDFMRLISRAFQEPNPELKKFVEQEFAEVARRFDSAILRAVPGLPPGELFWRMNFLFGALHHGQTIWLRFDQVPRPAGRAAVKPDREGFIQRVISFVTAGLSAPLPKVRSTKR